MLLVPQRERLPHTRVDVEGKRIIAGLSLRDQAAHACSLVSQRMGGAGWCQRQRLSASSSNSCGSCWDTCLELHFLDRKYR